MKPEAGRLHHLDALRALAMILILPAHALALIGMRGGWNDFEAGIFWTLHVFRMPLFFLVAGFFGALMIEARGVGPMLRNRGVRIAIPLAVGTILVVPPLTACMRANSALPFHPGSLAAPYPNYLWFLWYLLLLYGAALLLRRLLSTRTALRNGLAAGANLLRSPVAPLALAVPCGLLLYRQPTWIVESTVSDSFVPALDLLAYYGLFFICGWALYATPGLREEIERRPGRYTLYAGLALPSALALYLLREEPAIGAGRWFHVLALVLLALTAWSIVLALIGLSRRHLGEANPQLRFWADASYWIYLSHFLPMAAIAAAIVDIGMPDGARFALLVGATALLICPAYGAFVRYSPVGRVLHGPRARPAVRPQAFTPPARAAAPPA